jgi:tetratricopeptide (TPR) repeat protein
VDRGLLGLRGGLLDVFGDEQLSDSLQATGKALPQLELQYEAVTESIVAGVEVEREWLDDLVTLTNGLSKRGRFREVDATAAIIIRLGLDNASFYLALAIACTRQGNYAGADEHFTTAIARGEDNADVYYLRGLVRTSQGNHSGAK